VRYSDDTPIRAGDVVRIIRNGPERYIVMAFDQSNTVKIVGIGTVTKEGAPSFGETIFLPQGYTRDVPAGELTRIGSARITIVDENPKI
jgi:hypothetical protein